MYDVYVLILALVGAVSVSGPFLFKTTTEYFTKTIQNIVP